MKKLLIVLTVLLSFGLKAQVIEPIKWSFEHKQNGNEVELIFTATMEPGWHLYDTYLPEGGPIPTEFVFNDTTLFEKVGELQKTPEPIEKFDNIFQLNLRFFSDKAVFTQKIRLLTDNAVDITGHVLFMGCDDEMCLPPNEAEFSFSMKGKAVTTSGSEDTEKLAGIAAGAGGSSTQTLWVFILISFLAGLAAILTPCVFPMIPMTVSFFMRGSQNRGKAIRTALFFGLSIVGIFTLLGALFSFGVFGPNAGNILSTHWIPNMIFFVLFFIFALSFFGLFEIVLPSSLVNKTDAKADQGGFIGAFFMALTTVIVSFSCTGPFIGALIIEAVQGGGMRPLLGMFFFGLAFATPFTMLAIFPSALSKLPKSGGWLNAIKVVFAFILLAFGLKFLSNIDQVYGFNILNREIYLAIWIVLFALLGFYFLGKIKFSHDSDVPFLSVGRLMLSIVTFTFVIYLYTGLHGAPLSAISSLLPPPSSKTQLVTVGTTGMQTNADQALCGPAKYADKLHLPHGLQGYFDYEQGMACAREKNKPVFLVFKGHACANCKKMENSVWTDPEVLRMLSQDYVVIALYTDDRTSLPESEWVTSKLDGKALKTMGKVNLDFQIANYNTNTIPYHVIIGQDGTQHELAVTFDNNEFREFISKGL
ncbi:thiol:disulfide interchange protein [Bacteroidales bacterium 6E]|nr:thiol:disulfide interchange protein [Bacteroidales bacterium 6E]